MPFQLQHFREQELILIRVQGDVSIEDYQEISLQYLAALEQVESHFDVLVDLRAMHRFPTSISQLRQASLFVGSPKVGWIILLTGDRPILKMVATVLLQLQTQAVRMRVFNTLEESITFLQGLQPTDRERLNRFDDLYDSIK